MINLPPLKGFRKTKRQEMTPAEAKLWAALKSRPLGGRKFTRQHSIGPYVLDFYCPEESLAVELDGAHHSTLGAEAYDHERALFRAYFGVKVLRFENKWVYNQSESVLAAIQEAFGWNQA